MRWGICLAAAVLLLTAPATAVAMPSYQVRCESEFCGGVSEDGSRAVFPFHEELTAGAPKTQIYERSDGVTRALVPYPKHVPEQTYTELVGLSADARHAFVATNLSLVSEDLDEGATDLYEISGGIVTLLSANPLGDQAAFGIGPAAPPAVFFADSSPDGRRVFLGTSKPLVAEDTDECPDIYERFEGRIRLISTGPTATPSFTPPVCDAASYGGLSADGSHVFFKTADHLIAEDEGGDDIYQRVGDALSVLTTYQEHDGTCLDMPEFSAASADGSTLLFSTNMPISPEDKDSTFDVYKREPDGTFTLVSRGTEGPVGQCSAFGGDRPVALSADGHTAIFETNARLSSADKDSSPDLYSANDSGETSLISTGPADTSPDERVMVQPAWPADVSNDARHVAFETRQPLVAEDRDHAVDVYLRAGERTELVSAGPVGGNAEIRADLLSISGDGQTVAFATKERLTAEDTDRKMDFYLYRAGKLNRPGSASISSGRRGRTVLLSAESIPPRMRVSPRGRRPAADLVEIRLGCPRAETDGPCHGKVKVTVGRRGWAIGTGRFRIPRGRHDWVSVLLHRPLPRRSPIFARVRGVDRLGNAATEVRRITLVAR